MKVLVLTGPESSGKTTLTLQVIAEMQKQAGTCAFIDAEHALDTGYAEKLGVNVSTVWRWEKRSAPAKWPVVKAIERLSEEYPSQPERAA